MDALNKIALAILVLIVAIWALHVITGGDATSWILSKFSVANQKNTDTTSTASPQQVVNGRTGASAVFNDKP